VKLAPDSTITTAGLFFQGEVVNPAGNFTTVVAARLDNYRLDPHVDADFTRSNVNNLP